MTKNELFEQFRGYLIGGDMKASSSSFISYLKDMDQKIPSISDLLDAIANCRTTKEKISLANQILSEIEIAFKRPLTPLKYKKSDYTGTIKKLIDLLSGSPCINKRKFGKTVTPPLILSSNDFDIVLYENSVPTSEQILGLCEFLKEQYEQIRIFAQRILANICQTFPAIPVYLSKECPEKTYYYEREFLLKQMREYCSKCKKDRCKPPYCNVSEVLERYAPFKDNIIGRFYGGSEPHIVLYFKNFNSPSMSNELYLAEITAALAHEYMHFLHYIYAGNEYAIASKELKEALADFFGVLFSIHRNESFDQQVAENQYHTWKDREGSAWPYAYALHFLNKPYKPNLSDYTETEMNDSIEKLRKVFLATTDAGNAYSELTK